MPTRPTDRTNNIGLTLADYKGLQSSLCQGCGHNSISSQIISVAYELDIKPHEIVRLSGIGCSSKSPAYFLGRSHGFNSLHGRMPSVATGVLMANHNLIAIGVSGDGDTASIGMGQFKHLLRRNVRMVYIVENNGVYGLTKGQFSATADEGQELKYAGLNYFPPEDLCLEAIASSCGFVARSFSGDPKQVRELLKAAFSHQGTAFIDIISPCVTFNNRDTSTKSYAWGKEHAEPLQEFTYLPKDYVPSTDEIKVDNHFAGEVRLVELHDGSFIQLRKLEEDYDPTDRSAALQRLELAHLQDELITGLIYYNPDRRSLADVYQLGDIALSYLPESKLRSTPKDFQEVMDSFL